MIALDAPTVVPGHVTSPADGTIPSVAIWRIAEQAEAAYAEHGARARRDHRPGRVLLELAGLERCGVIWRYPRVDRHLPGLAGVAGDAGRMGGARCVATRARLSRGNLRTGGRMVCLSSDKPAPGFPMCHRVALVG